MNKIVLCLMLLVGCGGPDESSEPQVAMTADGPVVLPAGWVLHWYPALCVVVARDADGRAQVCHSMFPTCQPTTAGGCGALSLP